MPELTHEEKEAKKSTRPKTRFGRVSKPPKHMVKVSSALTVLPSETPCHRDRK